MPSSFNDNFKKYYDYNPTEELELLSQVYTHDNTEELTHIVTMVKKAPFTCKLHINTVKVGAKILLLIEVVHPETIDPGTVKRCVRDIKHNIRSSNIKIVSQPATLGDFEALICFEFVPAQYVDVENEGEPVNPEDLKGEI